MPSGGHGSSGPPPDPNALARDRDKADWTTLPSHREGPAPAWPLTRVTKRELVIWERLWERPQAVMWERSQQFDEVAIYARQLVRCEARKATATDRTLLVRLMETLGLSLPGLARNHWRIEGDEPQAAPRTSTAPAATVKDRFRVLDGTG